MKTLLKKIREEAEEFYTMVKVGLTLIFVLSIVFAVFWGIFYLAGSFFISIINAIKS